MKEVDEVTFYGQLALAESQGRELAKEEGREFAWDGYRDDEQGATSFRSVLVRRKVRKGFTVDVYREFYRHPPWSGPEDPGKPFVYETTYSERKSRLFLCVGGPSSGLCLVKEEASPLGYVRFNNAEFDRGRRPAQFPTAVLVHPSVWSEEHGGRGEKEEER